MAAPRIRSTSTIRRHHKDQPPGHRPRNHPNPRTKLEIARRHRNQPAQGSERPQPPATAPPQNHGIPTPHSHHHHQPPAGRPPRPSESRTKSGNASQRPIQSTKASDVNPPCNHSHTANRGTSTIRRHHKDQPPGHRPRNHPNPRTKLEIARRHRNQSTPTLGHTRPRKLFTPIKSASASAVISPLLPTLRHPSASVEGYGIHATGFRGRTTHDTLPGTRSHDTSVGTQLHDMSADTRSRGFRLDNKKPRGVNSTGYCGQSEIRTRGGLHHNGFQDRLHRPLGHLSMRLHAQTVMLPQGLHQTADQRKHTCTIRVQTRIKRKAQASHLRGSMTSLPPMYGRMAFGISMEPSAC